MVDSGKMRYYVRSSFCSGFGSKRDGLIEPVFKATGRNAVFLTIPPTTRLQPVIFAVSVSPSGFFH
jgi:hypothetical protein